MLVQKTEQKKEECFPPRHEPKIEEEVLNRARESPIELLHTVLLLLPQQRTIVQNRVR